MRTVVAVYDRFDQAQRAVQTLVNEQFHSDDITLISRDSTGRFAEELNQAQMGSASAPSGEGASAGMGAVLGGLGGLLVGLSTLAIPGVGPVIAAGPIVAGLTGAGIGALAGGLLGGLTDMGIPDRHANLYAEGIRRGGTLVVVRSEDQQAERARQLLNRFNPVDIESKGRAWREAGWTQFDQNAPAISSDQLEFNRAGKTQPARSQASYSEPASKEAAGGKEAASGMDEHLSEDVYSNERVHNEMVDMPVTGGTVEQVDIHPVDLQDWPNFDTQFRQDYLTRFGQSGNDYRYYQPAYRFGYDMSSNPHYRGYTWDQVMPEARQEYERSGAGAAWEDVQEAVHYAWDLMARQ